MAGHGTGGLGHAPPPRLRLIRTCIQADQLVHRLHVDHAEERLQNQPTQEVSRIRHRRAQQPAGGMSLQKLPTLVLFCFSCRASIRPSAWAAPPSSICQSSSVTTS
eukprot:8219821-Pyramimonas_sp.AAC.1